MAGASVYSGGEFIATDRPFDDTGADALPDTEVGGAQPVYDGLCGNSGAFRHGDGSAWQTGTADLDEIRIAADDDAYYVLFQLQTLVEPGDVRVGLVVDGHRLEVTAADAFLDRTPVIASVDTSANTIEARVPRSLLPEGIWHVSAYAALPDGTVEDLVFVQEQITADFNCWQDRRQSQLIAAGSFPVQEIDPGRLRDGFSSAPSLLRGAMVRLHVPSIDMGEGVTGQPKYGQDSSASIYRGALQPYAAYVPASYDPEADNPLIVLLHCLNCNHNTFHIASWPGITELAESRGAIIVTPLAYGEGGHYEEEAEWDVFDVLSDVSARYRIDPERMYLTGMSMGSLGTFRLGLLYPDLWARAFGIGNYTNPFCVTPSQRTGCPGAINYFDILENARNLPWGLVNGLLDELTPATGVREIADRFEELGYEYRYWEYLTRRHEPSLHGLTTDVTDPFLGDARRAGRPADVGYSIERSMQSDPWHLVHDRAYWLRDMRLADGAARGRVFGIDGQGELSMQGGRDGGTGSSVAGPYVWRGIGEGARYHQSLNEVSLVLEGMASLTIDTDAAWLLTGEPFRYSVDTDTAVTVTFSGWGRTLTLPAGTHQGSFVP